MKFNLIQILESTVLLEGRLEDVKAKYPGNNNEIDELSSSDPSGNNKYLEWMTKQVFKNNQGLGDVIGVIEKFHVSGDRLKKHKQPTDINQYKSIQQLLDTLDKLPRREAPSKKELKGTGELVYDGPKLYVVAPRNYEGSCKWGLGAQWCIAQSTTDSHYNSYTKHSLFYFVISKTLPTSDNNYKIAIQKNMDTNQNTYWDVPDQSSKTPQNTDITSDILAIIDQHAVEAKKHIFKKLVEDMLSGVPSTLSTQNIMKVKEQLTDGQLYKILSNDLTKMDSRLFQYVSGKFGPKNTIKLLTSNYESLVKLLSNDEILEYIDENTERPEKLEMAGELTGHLRTVSSNIKAKIQKWGMTDEAWERYNSHSSYVFLGEEDGTPFGGVYKVDKFEPKSYDILSKLKLKIKIGGNVHVLYGVSTGKDELHGYTDGDALPESALSGHKVVKVP
jgi:hypothetical protein